MDWFTLITLIWLCLSAWLGYRKRFWQAFAALVSLLGAYVLSVVGAGPVAGLFEREHELQQLSPLVLWGITAVAIFVLAGMVIRLAIALIAKSLPRLPTRLDQWLGAGLGVVNGALLAVGVIWSSAFLKETMALQGGSANPKAVWQGDPPKVVQWSRELMSALMSWSQPKVQSQDDPLASLPVMFMAEPVEMVNWLNKSLRSTEFRTLVSSLYMQHLVDNSDYNAIAESEEFRRFIESPAASELKNKLAENGLMSDEQLAERLVVVWRKVEQLRSNPEIQTLLEDEEVQEFLAGNGKLTANLLAKAEKLFILLSQEL